MSRFYFLMLCGCALMLSNETMALGGLGMGHKAKSSNSSGVQAVRAYICTSLNCGKSDITLTQKCDNANAEMEYGVCQCKDGYIGNGKTCAQSTCTSGWMPNEDNSDCVSCPAGQECETCKSKSLFTPYGDGNGNCVCNNSSCPSGYYCNTEGACEACATPAKSCSIEADEKDPNTNCITTKKITCGENTYCETTGECTSCPENTPITDTQGRCVCTETSCPSGYYCNNEGTCKENDCSDYNEGTCPSGASCGTCQSGTKGYYTITSCSGTGKVVNTAKTACVCDTTNNYIEKDSACVQCPTGSTIRSGTTAEAVPNYDGCYCASGNKWDTTANDNEGGCVAAGCGTGEKEVTYDNTTHCVKILTGYYLYTQPKAYKACREAGMSLMTKADLFKVVSCPFSSYRNAYACDTDELSSKLGWNGNAITWLAGCVEGCPSDLEDEDNTDGITNTLIEGGIVNESGRLEMEYECSALCVR